MSVNIGNKEAAVINRHLEKAQQEKQDSMAKLVSGSRFAGRDFNPSDRSIASRMEFRLRSLTSAKRNINDATSLLQTADSSMQEVNNIISRMKELNISAASTAMSDQERRFLMIEYEALREEMHRIATVTEYNGTPLLSGDTDKTPETLIFRIDEPWMSDEDEDINTIRFEELREMDARPEALGILSALDLLLDTDPEEGISLEDVEELMIPEDDEYFATTYDQAIAILSDHRAVFGAMQSRLNRARDFTDVYQENIAAAKSRISDTDYAAEVTKLVQARIQTNAATSLLAQGNVDTHNVLKLLNTIP